MNLDQIRAQVRPIIHLVGIAFVGAALVKFTGFVPQIRTEFWQIAILGLALLHW